MDIEKTIRFVCPSCEKRYVVSATSAGRLVKCKNCDSEFRLPKLDEPTSTESRLDQGAMADSAKPPPEKPIDQGATSSSEECSVVDWGFKERFLHWYRIKFANVLAYQRPWNFIVQAAIWYFGCGFVWIPFWFVLTEEPIRTQPTNNGFANKTESKFAHTDSAETQAENSDSRDDPTFTGQMKDAVKSVDWAKVVVVTLKGIAIVVAAVVAMFVMAIAVIGAAAVAADSTCNHCGQAKRPGFPVCPNCGRNR